jgi:hypothetical protein
MSSNLRKHPVRTTGRCEGLNAQAKFSGFRSVATKAGLTCLDPQEDKGNQAEAARVAAAVIQPTRISSVWQALTFDNRYNLGIGKTAPHRSFREKRLFPSKAASRLSEPRFA